MPLPSSGLMSIDMIAAELKIANTNLELGDARLRTLAGIPSGIISLSDFYGKSAVPTSAINGASFKMTIDKARIFNGGSTNSPLGNGYSVTSIYREWTRGGKLTITDSKNPSGDLIASNGAIAGNQIVYLMQEQDDYFTFCIIGDHTAINRVRIRETVLNSSSDLQPSRVNEWIPVTASFFNNDSLNRQHAYRNVPMTTISVPLKSPNRWQVGSGSRENYIDFCIDTDREKYFPEPKVPPESIIINKDYIFEISTGTVSVYTNAAGFGKKFDSWPFNGPNYIFSDAGTITFTGANIMKTPTSSNDLNDGMLLGLAAQNGTMIIQVSGDQSNVKSITTLGLPGYSGQADMTIKTTPVTPSVKKTTNGRTLTEFVFSNSTYMGSGYRFSSVKLRFNT